MKKRIYFFSILFFLFVGVAICIYFFHSGPPLGQETVTDPAQYRNVNPYVETALADSFSGALPEKLSVLAEVDTYCYSYSCALFGDPEFYIILQVKYNDVNEFTEERSRLLRLSAGTASPNESGRSFLKGSPEEITAYLDDRLQDGTRYIFEIVQVNESQNTILYLVSQLCDGQEKSTEVVSILQNVIS